jgi:hypothetical protein
MTRALTILATFILVICLSTAGFAQGSYPGVVTVDSATAEPLQKVAVKVWLRDNNITVSAITLPLKFSSTALRLDSVSLQNSVWNQDFSGYFAIDNTARTARITILPNEMVYPLPAVSFTDGVIAELYFAVLSTTTPHRATIDSVYTDSSLGADVHIYTRIDIADNNGTGVFLPDFVPGFIDIRVSTGVEDDPAGSLLPAEFALDQNYPNPFNPTTMIGLSLPRSGMVRLDVFNILGQQTVTLTNGPCDAGRYTVDFDGANLPSGIYFYRLQYEGGTLTRKMMLVK